MISCEDNLSSLNLDVILSGTFNDNHYQSNFICDESYHPVCSKKYYEQLPDTSLSHMLATNTLLDLDSVNVWHLWCEAKSLTLPDKMKASYFSHTLLLIQAVLAGQGIALLDKSLIKNELATGDLIILDEDGFIPPKAAYYFIVKKQLKNHENIESLEQWVMTLFE
jgi:LysR family glycine cleavage system transcriptional activator